jgi:hypothetical protein
MINAINSVSMQTTNQYARNALLLLPIALFAIGLTPIFSGVAFADDRDNEYSHQHITALWNHGLVCGDHKCVPGESPQNPSPVIPVEHIR